MFRSWSRSRRSFSQHSTMTSALLLRSSAAASHFCSVLHASPILQQRRTCLSATTSAALGRAAAPFPPHPASTLSASSIAAFNRSSPNSTPSRRDSVRAMATSGEKLDRNTPDEKWKELLTAEQVRTLAFLLLCLQEKGGRRGVFHVSFPQPSSTSQPTPNKISSTSCARPAPRPRARESTTSFTRRKVRSTAPGAAPSCTRPGRSSTRAAAGPPSTPRSPDRSSGSRTRLAGWRARRSAAPNVTGTRGTSSKG